ncbi:MAG: nucleoside monophosphate kinase [Candidatus Babeliaceae bacterium]
MHKEIFIFMGPPGAGKGSLSQLCIKEFGWIQLSTGNLCRQHIMQGTEIGKYIDFIIKSGKLIPDSLIVEMIENWLKEHTGEYSALILDGFPRTVPQAQALDELLQKKQFAQFKVRIIGMHLSDKIAAERLLNRMVCQNIDCQTVYSLTHSSMHNNAGKCTNCFMPLIQRVDDSNSEVIQERLLIYQKHKNALFEYYKATGRAVHTLSVEKPLEEVFGQFVSLIRGKSREE